MEERRNQIVELINKRGNISFSELKASFSEVSEMTLRTDLKALDEAGRIIRVHGGARSVEVVVGTDDLFGKRKERNIEEKKIIARKAVSMIRPNSTFFLDSGSTTTEIAKALPDIPCQIFTSGISCVLELCHLEKPRINIPGGTLNRYSMSICGMQSMENIKNIHLETVFLGVTSYCSGFGFSCGVEDEARLKNTLVKQGEKIFVVMDSSKVGLKSTYAFCKLEDVDAIISDGKLPEEFIKECEGAGVTVY